MPETPREPTELNQDTPEPQVTEFEPGPPIDDASPDAPGSVVDDTCPDDLSPEILADYPGYTPDEIRKHLKNIALSDKLIRGISDPSVMSSVRTDMSGIVRPVNPQPRLSRGFIPPPRSLPAPVATPPVVTPPTATPPTATVTPPAPPKSVTTPLSKSDIYRAADLFRLAKDESDWLIDNLIREGNQVMLSGPPKSGKTILALQLAINLAERAPFFLTDNYPIKKPRKVLFISFEMRQKAMAVRLSKQTKSRTLENLHFIFRSESTQGSLFTLKPDSDAVEHSETAEVIQRQIRRLKPDLIIIDSLVQLHALDENSNLKMSGLMRNLRKLCSLSSPSTEEAYEADLTGDVERIETKEDKEKKIEASVKYILRTPIAHVVIHHTRKPPDNMKMYASPEAIRGASALHSEADLALTLANGYGGGFSLNISSRELKADKTAYYEILDKEGLLFIHKKPPKENKVTPIYARLFKTLKNGQKYNLADIHVCLVKQGLIKELTKSEAFPAFKNAFYTKLQTHGLNKGVSKKGPGGITAVELSTETEWEEFAMALMDAPPSDIDWDTIEEFDIPPYTGKVVAAPATEAPIEETPVVEAGVNKPAASPASEAVSPPDEPPSKPTLTRSTKALPPKAKQPAKLNKKRHNNK